MPKQIDHAQRRQELVAASWDVIAREGLTGLSLRKIADAAQCTTGRIVHYFDDRDALIRAALRSAHVAAGKRMAAVARETGSPRESLRAVLLEALPLDGERLKEWKIWVAFWSAAASDPELARENTRRYGAWRGLLQTLLAELNAEARTDELLALVDGIGLQLALAPLPENGRRAESLISDWITRL